MFKRAALVGLLLLAGCGDGRTPEQVAADRAAETARKLQQARYDNGKPVVIAEADDMRVVQWQVRRQGGGMQDLYVVPNATVVTREGCGKGCSRDVPTFSAASPATSPPASSSPLYAGLAGLTPEQRTALHLPDPADPRISGLAKLTEEEKRALGVEHVETELFPSLRRAGAAPF